MALRLGAFLLCALFLLPLCRVQAQTSDIWRGIDIASSSDNKTRLLWRHADGAATLQTLNAAGAVESGKKYGPFAGYSATAIAAGADSKTRVLWRRTDGLLSLWNVEAASGAFDYANYGPFADYSPDAIDTGPDNKTRVQWNKTDGLLSLWTINAPGVYDFFNYGPFAGWSAKTIGVGGDLKTRVLWRKTDGAASLWKINTPGVYDIYNFGPYVGWAPTDMALGQDNKIRMLWTKSDNSIALWRIGLDGQTLEVNATYGPYAGWTAAAIAVGGDGKTRVLWNHTDGRVSTWRVSLDSLTVENNVTFGPYTSTNPPPAPAPPPSTIAPSGVTLNPAQVLAGTTSTGTVTLASAAPAGGSSVALSSNSSSATVPASVTVAAGTTSAQFTISTTAVSSSTTATISATSGGVTKTAALVVNPRFAIININNNDVLSGQATIRVAVYDNAISVDQVQLKIDGTVFGSSNPQPGNSTSRFMFFGVQTKELLNGLHTLTVTDGTNNDTRTVEFRNSVYSLNYASIFDTSNTGDVPATARITAQVANPANFPFWKVEIRNDADVVVKAFTGSATTANPNIDVTWNGTNASGFEVLDGTYVALLTTSSSMFLSSAATPITTSGIGDDLVNNGQDAIINKHKLSNHFILISLEAFPGGSWPIANGYAKYIRQKCNALLTLSSPAQTIVVSDQRVNGNNPDYGLSGAPLRARIVNQRNVSVSFRQLFIFVVAVSWFQTPGAVGGNDNVAGRLQLAATSVLDPRLCISPSLNILSARCG